jgi:hypothetical protein
MAERFSYFMIFYSLRLGLAVGELFAGVGGLLREEQLSLRKTGSLVPLLSLIVLVEIMSAFIDAWDRFQSIGSMSLELMAPSTLMIIRRTG